MKKAERAIAFSREDLLATETKLDLVHYYAAVADGALRGIVNRPIVLSRYVTGAEKEPFFQKRAPEKRPDWIETVWAGDTITTDLACDLQLPGGAVPEAHPAGAD